MGVSGVGKTTLLRLLAGLEHNNRECDFQITSHKSLLGKVAYMAQGDLLLPWLTVIDNVIIGARLRGEKILKDRAYTMLEKVGLADNADEMPSSLSGGMRQRAALARTLMEDRPIVLMDEPFSSLDMLTKVRLQDLAAEILQGKTVLMVTHDTFEAYRLSNDICILSGCPAYLDKIIKLLGPTPRDIQSQEVLEGQAELLRYLSGSEL